MTDTQQTDLIHRVDAALDTIRPHMVIDGGNVELIGVTPEGIAQIKWMGNCEGCNMSFMTLRAGIEQTLIASVPEIKGVEAVN